MPAQVVSRIRNAGDNSDAQGMAQFDITLAAPDGTVCAEIRGFALRKLQSAISAQPQRRPQPARSLSPAERRLHHNISQGIPADIGPSMLSRAVSTGLAQVFVSSLDLPSLIAEAGRTEEAAPSEGGFERRRIFALLDRRDGLPRHADLLAEFGLCHLAGEKAQRADVVGSFFICQANFLQGFSGPSAGSLL